MSLLFCILLSTCLSIQKTTLPPNAGAPSFKKAETIKKDLLDTALFRVYYNYSFLFKQYEEYEKQESATTLLQIGKKWLKFTDYYKLKYDSFENAAAQQGKSYAEIRDTLSTMYKKSQINYHQIGGVFIDLGQSKYELILKISFDYYTYTETLPAIQWQLQDGDTIIAGYACKKATAPYRGRQYIAWYAPELKLPFGPYVFGGLPGLIFHIADTQNHHRFTLSGLTQLDYQEGIYKKIKKGIIPMKRNKVRALNKNYHERPGFFFVNAGDHRIKFVGKNAEEAKKEFANMPPILYNPIELE